MNNHLFTGRKNTGQSSVLSSAKLSYHYLALSWLLDISNTHRFYIDTDTHTLQYTVWEVWKIHWFIVGLNEHSLVFFSVTFITLHTLHIDNQSGHYTIPRSLPLTQALKRPSFNQTRFAYNKLILSSFHPLFFLHNSFGLNRVHLFYFFRPIHSLRIVPYSIPVEQSVQWNRKFWINSLSAIVRWVRFIKAFRLWVAFGIRDFCH